MSEVACISPGCYRSAKCGRYMEPCDWQHGVDYMAWSEWFGARKCIYFTGGRP